MVTQINLTLLPQCFYMIDCDGLYVTFIWTFFFPSITYVENYGKKNSNFCVFVDFIFILYFPLLFSKYDSRLVVQRDTCGSYDVNPLLYPHQITFAIWYLSCTIRHEITSLIDAKAKVYKDDASYS